MHPYSGRWHTVGDNGAEFTNIPKGAIVFNHRQTEALLERGWVNGRGSALASGTAMVTGGIPVSNANRKTRISILIRVVLLTTPLLLHKTQPL